MHKCKYFKGGKLTISDPFGHSVEFEDDGRGVNEDELDMFNGIFEGRYTVIRVLSPLDRLCSNIALGIYSVFTKLQVSDVAMTHASEYVIIIFIKLPPHALLVSEVFEKMKTVSVFAKNN